MTSWIGTGVSNPGDATANGKTGIGTTGPSSRLQVRVGGANRIDEAGLQYDTTTHKLGFKTNTADDRVVINSSGNVGIGNTCPSAGIPPVRVGHEK